MEQIKCHKCGSVEFTSSPGLVKCSCEQNEMFHLIETNPGQYLERLNLLVLASLTMSV